jgi:CubicO group peptidase (beta-lactamase class C family)
MSRVVSPESVGMSAQRLARIKPHMQKYVDQGQFAGISTLVARRGSIVHFEQVGWQDRENQIPLAPDTIFRIYSMTKPIICTALMMLHEEGRFQLFDPLAKYIPAFGNVKVYTESGLVDPIQPILVRDLFTHTSGLTYDFLDSSPVCALYREAGLLSNASRTLEQMIDEMARLPLAYQPNTVWHYSMGIDVLARLIEVLSGQSLQTFLSERLFGLLGMVDTGFSVAPEKRSRVSKMYGYPDIATHAFNDFIEAWQAGNNQRIDAVDTTYPVDSEVFARGGHGLFSTAEDYLRFAQMLLNGGTFEGQRLLSRKTLELMHQNHLPQSMLPYGVTAIPILGYGFGLGSRVMMNVAEAMIPSSVGEFGWSGAAKTYFWVDPKEELIGILMSQFMMSFDTVDKELMSLTYQAIDD